MSGMLLQHLPAIYQANEQLQRFLDPLETVLLGPGGGLRDLILNIPDLFDPQTPRTEFLPWLASWVGLSLRTDLPLERRRALIAQAVPLHMQRGTMYAVKTLLELVTGGQVSITEPEIVGLRVGVSAHVGSTTRLGRELPHFFEAAVYFATDAAPQQSWLESLARETLDLAKPAHTYYDLKLSFSGAGGTY